VAKEASAHIVKVPTDDEIRAAFEPYVAAVGRVSHAWNYLHERLGQLFVGVTECERKIALAVWYSTKSDRGQREMLEAAIRASDADRWLPRLPAARADLLWMLNEADHLAEVRNDAMHVPCSAYTSEKGTEMGVAFFNGNPRARKLFGMKIIQEFEWCEQNTEALTRFAEKAETALAFERYPWPERPPMATRGHQKTALPQSRGRPRAGSRQASREETS
jgi:hypothetical protein